MKCKVENCPKDKFARGMCGAHYAKWYRQNGEFLRKPDEERFWSNVEIGAENECWEWVGTRSNKGYGRFYVGFEIGAHRYSWQLHFGLIDDGFEVCHHCDNPPCVNPKHLFTGLHSENAFDMVLKGRSWRPKGELNNGCKLRESDVRAIRELRGQGLIYRDIASKFGISKAQVERIINGKRWGDLA